MPPTQEEESDRRLRRPESSVERPGGRASIASERPSARVAGHDLELILETAHEAFISMDEDGVVTGWNREAERTFGWPKDAVLGWPLRDVVIPDRYRRRHDEGLRRFLATGEGPLLGRRVEMSALHRSGREFPVELTVSALSRSGRWSFHAFVHDISDRHRANEAQARLASIVEHSADAIVSRTADGVVATWNPAAERLFGYSAAEMVGRTLDPLVPGDRAGEAEELVARVLDGEAVVGFETQRVCKDGRLLDVSITISPIRDAAGRVRELSLIARDVSARKASLRALEHAYAELERVNQLKGRFVATASHELRTPLTSIRGFATTLLDRWHALGDGDKRRFLELIEGQSERLTRIVGEILTLARIDSGKMPVAPDSVNVADVARTVVDEQGLGESVTVTAARETVAYADPDHVHRILVNYLANACAHGEPPLRIAVDATDDEVVVRVSDCGPGVPADFVPDLFQSFTQGRVTSLATPGSGLGLAIVKGLAETAGGRAWYEPNHPRGACFCVALPRP